MADTVTAPRRRDLFLDLLRAISIVRVVIIHLLNRAEFFWWPAPTYVMPGMPLVFFVSGGLAYQSLRLRDGVRRAATVYWRKTFRRLLLPYWSFYLPVTVIALVGDALSDSPRWTVRYHSLVLGATGLIVPKPSPAVSSYIGHLWFMSVFLVMTLLAPFLVRAFERTRAGVYLALGAVLVVVQWIDVAEVAHVPRELDRLSLFAVFYCVGFLYTDGTLVGRSARSFVGVAVVCALLAWWYNGIEPGAVNAHDIKHLFVGLGWMALLLAAAPLLRRVADRGVRVLEAVTRRTFTTYLWGWPTCALASEVAEEVVDGVWAERGVMAALSLAFLAVAIVVFGWFEDYAAGRVQRPASTRLRPRYLA